MYYAVDALDGVGQVRLAFEIGHQDEVQPVFPLRPRGEHLVSFGFGTGGAADLVAAPEQRVDDMAADEAGGAGDEDVAGRLCEMCVVLTLGKH